MKVLVGQHELKIDKKDKVNQNEYKVTKCEFEFDEAITNDLVKIALFTNSAGTYKQYIVNNECDIPAEILEKQETTTLGVYAYKEENGELELRYSPEEIKFYVSNGSYKANAQNTEPITPTDKEQMESQISQNTSDISDLQANKQDKLTVGDNITIDENNVISAVDTIYDDTEIKADIQELQETKVDKDVNNLTYYTLTTETGSKITLSIDSSTYVMTLKLKDKNNNDISTANVDLPLETMVVGARYDSATKEIVLTLKNGQEVRFSVADLVSGLQTEITENNKLSSDLVDDTNNTNKFVSASEKEQITTNKNDIIAIKDGEEIDSFSDVENAFADVETALNLKEDKSNKVTEINSSSTDTQYPSAKCVYDSQEEQNEKIAELEMLYNAFPTVSDEDTTIQLDNTAKVKFREIDLKGNTSQVVIPEEQGTNVSNTSIYVSDVNTDKENTIEMSGNTYQETTTGANIVPCLNIERTINGVTCTPQSDGTIILNGTATTQVLYPIANNSSTSIGHTISVEANSYKFMLYGDTNVSNNTYFLQVGYYASDGTTAKFYNVIGDTPLEIPTNQQIGVGLIIRQGQSFNNYIIKPMVVLSTYTGGFEPYTYGASPNPSYPQNIEVVTGENNITICGKNLFDKNNVTLNEYIRDDGTTLSSDYWDITHYIRIMPNETFTYNGLTSVGTSVVQSAYYDKNKNYISVFKQATGTNTITPPANAYYVRFSINKGSNDKDTFMIEQGSTATTYEQYQGTTYPINLGNIELCKIDTYKDRIYKQNNKWYLEKNIGKETLDGSNDEGWGKLNREINGCYAFRHNGSYSEILICDKLTNYTAVQLYQGIGEGIGYSSAGGYLAVYIKAERVSSYNVAALRAFLANNPITFYYQLSTPTTTEITDTTLVNQLNALYNATIYPITNINTNTINLLPYIDLHYNFVTPSPSPSRPSVVNVVKEENTITISNSDNTESQVFSINLGDMELCKIGTYQDKIYKQNDKWYLEKNINKVVLDGTQTITATTQNNVFYLANITDYRTNNNTPYSNYYKGIINVVGASDMASKDNNTIAFLSSSSPNARYYIKDTRYTNASDLTLWLSTHNTIVYYVLATPTITEITDTTLIEQLDNLENAYSYDTQTNITQTNDDMPFILDVEAILSLKNIFNS